MIRAKLWFKINKIYLDTDVRIQLIAIKQLSLICMDIETKLDQDKKSILQCVSDGKRID